MRNKTQNEVRTEIFTANRPVFMSTLLFSFVVNILALTGSLFMLQVYDRVIPSGSIPTLVALSLIVLVLYGYYGLIDYVRSRIFVRVGRRVEENLRKRVFDVMSKLSLNKANGLGSQPLQDLTAIRQFISGQGPFAYFDMPYVPVYLAVVFMLHWALGLVAVAAAIIIFVLALLAEHATRKPAAEANQVSHHANLMTEEIRRNAEALFSLGMKSALRDRWAQVQGDALELQTRANDAGATFTSASRVFRMVVQSAMLAAAAWLAVMHEISSGSIIASSIIMGRALAPIDQAVGGWQQFLGARKAYERLGKLLRENPEDMARMKLPQPLGLVEAENLALVMPGADKPLLQNVSFKVEPGKGLGIIGPTGAGKSTLARALVGLVTPARGAVRLDGATPDQRDSDELGRLIGYLPQDIQLFNGTVAENIARFTAHADPQKIVAAAKLANIHDFVVRLPQGYDTPLLDGGSRLSAGQKQRLGLARALFGDPVVLVLDEPNSNLDAEGELALERAIRATLMRKASVITVAHRPSALNAMDEILVLANGQVAAQGPKAEILARVGPRPAQPPVQEPPRPVQSNVLATPSRIESLLLRPRSETNS